MTGVVNTIELRAGSNSKQLFGPQSAPVMVQNQGDFPVALSEAITTSQSINLPAGQSITWPADTSCYASTEYDATVAIGVGATAGPVSIVEISGTATVDATGSTVALAAGSNVEISGTPTVDASGSTVSLAAGTTVDASGSTISLASGTAVEITGTTDISGTVDLAAGTEVAISSGSVSLAASTANIGTVAVNGPIALASDTSVSISGTPTVDATGSTVGLASGTTVDASGSTVALADGTTVELAAGTSVEISSGTVTLAAGTADIGTVAVNGPVALSSDTSVAISGTPTVDATGSTVGLASGTTVDASGSTVGLASGTTVDVGSISGTVELAAGTAAIGTVDLAAGTSVEISSGTVDVGSISGSVELAAGTAVIGTVDLASGASVDITSGTVDIGTVSGNVGIVNGTGETLLSRTIPTGSDISVASDSDGSNYTSSNSGSQSILVNGYEASTTTVGQLAIRSFILGVNEAVGVTTNSIGNYNLPFVSGTLTLVPNGLESAIEGPVKTSFGTKNLLPATANGNDATSFENPSASAGGWTGANCTLASAPYYPAGTDVGNNPDFYTLHGNFALKVNASAAGGVYAKAPAVDVTPGEMYTAYCPVLYGNSNSDTAPSVGAVIVWLDSSGSEVSQISSPYVTPSKLSYNVCKISGPAPSSATTAQLLVYFNAVGAGQTIYLDMVGLAEGSKSPSQIELFTLAWTIDGSHNPYVTMDYELNPPQCYVPTSSSSTLVNSVTYYASTYDTFGESSSKPYTNDLLSGYQAGSTTVTSTSLTSNIDAAPISLIWNKSNNAAAASVNKIEDSTLLSGSGAFVQLGSPGGSTDRVVTTSTKATPLNGDESGVIIVVPQ